MIEFTKKSDMITSTLLLEIKSNSYPTDIRGFLYLNFLVIFIICKACPGCCETTYTMVYYD